MDIGVNSGALVGAFFKVLEIQATVWQRKV